MTNAWVDALRYCGRWIAVAPGALTVGVVAYFVSSIANGIGGEIASGIVWLIASGTAGYVAVAAAKIIAPEAKQQAGISVSVLVFLFALCRIGNVYTQNTSGEFPRWYLVVCFVVLVIGSILGAADGCNDDLKFPIVPSTTVRWILFLPVAIISAIPTLALDTFVTIQFGQLGGVTEVLMRFLSGIIFISVATAVAPKGKKIVAGCFGGLWFVAGIFPVLTALSRPAINAWLNKDGQEMHYYLPAWLQIGQGLAWVFAAAIPVVTVFKKKRQLFREQSSR